LQFVLAFTGYFETFTLN